MSDTIQIRAGNKLGMPTLADREIAYVRNENALYIGTGDGNKRIGEELNATVNSLLSSLARYGERLTNLDLFVEELCANQDGHRVSIAENSNAIAKHGTAIEAQGKTVAEHSTAIAEQKAALDGKLSASPVAAQASVAADADLATVVAALNALIAAMKNSGVMNT